MLACLDGEAGPGDFTEHYHLIIYFPIFLYTSTNEECHPGVLLITGSSHVAEKNLH